MIDVKLPLDLEERLNKLVQQTRHTKSYYLKRALEDFLDEQEDLLLAESRRALIQSGQEKLYSLEETKKILGLDAH